MTRLLMCFVAMIAVLCADGEEQETWKSDSFGDALPWPAQARFGTLRFAYNGRLETLAWSPDGRFIAVSGRASKTTLFDAHSGIVAKTSGRYPDVGNDKPVVVFSADGKRLLCSAFNHLDVWTVDYPQELKLENRIVKESCCTAAFDPAGKFILTGNEHGDLERWSVGSHERFPRQSQGRMLTSAISPNGRLALTGGRYGTLLFWVLDDKYCTPLSGHSEYKDLLSVAFTRDGKSALSVSQDNTIRMWDVETHKELRVIDLAKDDVRHVAFSPDGMQALICTRQYLRVVSLETGKILCQHNLASGHSITCGAFAPDGKTFATGTFHGLIQFWNATTAEQLMAPGCHGGEVYPAIFSKDEKFVFTGCRDGVRKWNTQTGELVKHFGAPRTFRRHSLCISPDGTQLLTISGNSVAELWDAQNCEMLRTVGRNGTAVHEVDFAADGKIFILYENGKFGEIIDSVTGNIISRLELPGQSKIVYFSFSADGKKVAMGTMNSSAQCVADTASGRILASMPVKDLGQIVSFNLSADGRRLITAHNIEKAIIWDAENGTPIRELETGAFCDYAGFSPNGKNVVTCASKSGYSKGVLWHAATGSKIGTFHHELGSMYYGGFSPDGRYLLTVSNTGPAHVWDAETAVPLLKLDGHRSTINFPSWAPSGTALLTPSDDGTAVLWKLYQTPPQSAFDWFEKQRPGSFNHSPESRRNTFEFMWNNVERVDRPNHEMLLHWAVCGEMAQVFLEEKQALFEKGPSEWVKARIQALSSDSYETREKATQELESKVLNTHENGVEDALKILADDEHADLEARVRATKLLAGRDSPSRQQNQRAFANHLLRWIAALKAGLGDKGTR